MGFTSILKILKRNKPYRFYSHSPRLAAENALVILIGLYVLIMGPRVHEKIHGTWSIRALIVLPATVALFGVLMEKAISGRRS